MIHYGNSRSIPKLKRLWKECFADEDAYIDAFFEAMYEDAYVLLEEENGVLLGASFFLPGKIWLERPGTAGAGTLEKQGLSGGWEQREGEWKEIRYVYALAVWPQYRGRGIAARLLNHAHKIYDAPLIAEPAEEGLVEGFYHPLGFAKNFYLDKKRVELPVYHMQAAEIPAFVGQETSFFPIQAEAYSQARDTILKKHGYISWPVRHVAFALRQHQESGGGAFAVSRNGRKELLLYYQEGQRAVVTETTLTQEEAQELFLPRMAGRCSQAVFTSPAEPSDNAEYASDTSRCLTGMSLGLPPVHGYLNLSLD